MVQLNIIPLAAETNCCPSCGTPIAHLTTGGRTYPLDAPVHGLTERYDPQGRVTAYDHTNVWPAHTCT